MRVIAQVLGVHTGDLVRAGKPSHAMAAGPLFRAVDDDAGDQVGDTLTGLADALLSSPEADPVDQFFLRAVGHGTTLGHPPSRTQLRTELVLQERNSRPSHSEGSVHGAEPRARRK